MTREEFWERIDEAVRYHDRHGAETGATEPVFVARAAVLACVEAAEEYANHRSARALAASAQERYEHARHEGAAGIGARCVAGVLRALVADSSEDG